MELKLELELEVLLAFSFFGMFSFSSGLSFTNLTVVWLLVGYLDLWNSREACKTKAFFPWAATENDFKYTVQKGRVLSLLSFCNPLLYSDSLNPIYWKWLLKYLAFLFDIYIIKNVRKTLNWNLPEIDNIKYFLSWRILEIYNMISDF